MLSLVLLDALLGISRLELMVTPLILGILYIRRLSGYDG
jgi:hypothetical protein